MWCLLLNKPGRQHFGKKFCLLSSLPWPKWILFLHSDTGSGTPISSPRLHQPCTTFAENSPWILSTMIIWTRSRRTPLGSSGRGNATTTCSPHLCMRRDFAMESGIIHASKNTSNFFVDKKDSLHLLQLLSWWMDVPEVLCCAHCGRSYERGK